MKGDLPSELLSLLRGGSSARTSSYNSALSEKSVLSLVYQISGIRPECNIPISKPGMTARSLPHFIKNTEGKKIRLSEMVYLSDPGDLPRVGYENNIDPSVTTLPARVTLDGKGRLRIFVSLKPQVQDEVTFLGELFVSLNLDLRLLCFQS
jgi:hypothetical protein